MIMFCDPLKCIKPYRSKVKGRFAKLILTFLFRLCYRHETITTGEKSDIGFSKLSLFFKNHLNGGLNVRLKNRYHCKSKVLVRTNRLKWGIFSQKHGCQFHQSRFHKTIYIYVPVYSPVSSMLYTYNNHISVEVCMYKLCLF